MHAAGFTGGRAGACATEFTCWAAGGGAGRGGVGACTRMQQLAVRKLHTGAHLHAAIAPHAVRASASLRNACGAFSNGGGGGPPTAGCGACGGEPGDCCVAEVVVFHLRLFERRPCANVGGAESGGRLRRVPRVPRIWACFTYACGC